MLLELLWDAGSQGPVVDIMCGSGTTLLESLLAGRSAIGVDVNPVSVLISQTKTEKANTETCSRAMASIRDFLKNVIQCTIKSEQGLFADQPIQCIEVPRKVVEQAEESVVDRIGRWFSPEAAKQHAAIRVALESLTESPETRAIKLAWLRTIRKSSFASSRTGRLFYDKQKTPKLPSDMLWDELSVILSSQSNLPDFPNSTCKVVRGSALRLSTTLKPINTAFWHPPYFALYKYSSDVLRLELEWLGADRKAIVADEIRDGFKTSNPLDANKYLEDCVSVWKELYRACAPGAQGVAINSDSTLAKKTLNIFSRFAEGAVEAGFIIEKIYRRETAGTQAQYHKSADSEIQTKFDYIIHYRKP
jgi:DNA modification methylase